MAAGNGVGKGEQASGEETEGGGQTARHDSKGGDGGGNAHQEAGQVPGKTVGGAGSGQAMAERDHAPGQCRQGQG